MGHSDPLSIANLVACYHALGNQAANAHAIATCRDYNKPWQQDLETRHNEQQLEKSCLKQIYGLHLALARARVQAETQLTADEKPGTSVGFRPHEIREKLICWRPSQPISYDTTLLRPDLVEHFSWGPRWARLFGQWLQQVSWDSQGTTALDTDVGITWLELALSLHMFTERWLPCVRPDDSGTEWVIFPCSNEETLAVGYLASDAAVTMWRMWTAYHSLLGTTSVIIYAQERIATIFGGFRVRLSMQWFKPRPLFPEVTRVVEQVADLMQGKTSFQVPLVSQLVCVGGSIPSKVWAKRKSHRESLTSERGKCLLGA